MLTCSELWRDREKVLYFVEYYQGNINRRSIDNPEETTSKRHVDVNEINDDASYDSGDIPGKHFSSIFADFIIT